ncbi:hypothetical protein [Haloglomus litoreum]|uniref:hypothetical protein n=1 Tax=Haloglomus litoreum TaxID=3034026 RepID=UPI0023E80B25|nr:hypothetical protein [Haloglomus sp. DT116]
MDRGGPQARWDGRAQAIQLGALLLFAILIINLSLYQVFVVPNQNSEIEFKHNQQVQEELKTARSLAQQAAVTDSELSTSVRLAPQYPSRTVFVNPAPPAGTLETVDRSDLVVANAEPLDAEARQAWDTSGEAFATKALVFRPGYNYYSNAPTTAYGGSVLYNIQPDGATVRNRTGQSLVNGNRITLVTMTGAVSTSASGAETVEFQPTSAPTQRVPVRASGGDLTVRVKTRIPEDVWEDDLLAGQIDDPTADENGDGDNDEPGRYVTDVTMVSGSPPSSVGTLEITFESGPDKTYSLRMGQVGVGDNVADESASYITKVDPTADSLSVTEDEEREVVVEVRDRYNNPVSGVPVSVTDPSGAGDVTATEDTTDERGRASFVYEGSSTGTEDLEFAISDDSFQGTGSTSGLDDAEEVTYTATVNPAPGSGSGSGGGGGADYDLVWENPSDTAGVSTTSSTDCGSAPCPRDVDLAALTTDTDGNSLSTDGAPVSFGTSNDAVGTFTTTQTTTSAGRAETALDLADPRTLGEATLQTFSGGNRDTLAFDMQVTDSFDNDGALGPTWENIDSSDAVAVDSTASNSGSNAVQIGDVGEQGTDSDPGGGFVLADSIDTTGADTIVVEYWAQEGAGSGGPETGEGPEQLELQYKSGPDADDWTTADTLSVQNSPGTEFSRRVRIAAADAKRSDFKIRFVQPSSTGDDEWYVDDISLYVFGTTISGGTDGSGGTPADTTAPSVSSITVEGAPIDYTEAGSASSRDVTITYDEPMDQTVQPTVSFSDPNTAKQTISDPSGDGWTSQTEYVKTIDVLQNDEDVTVTVDVTGAEDQAGNTQNAGSDTFLVDTQRPGDVQDVVTKPDISQSNENVVTYGIQNPSTVYGDEDIRVTLEGPNGNTVSQRTAIQGSGGDTTDVTLDASGLADGAVSIEAVAIDDVDNTGATLTESGITKDTVAPQVSNYQVTREDDDEFTVTFDATEVTTSIEQVDLSVTGPGQRVAKTNTNNNTNGDTTSYEITYRVDQAGAYDVTLASVLDSVGNDGAGGETGTVVLGTAAERVSYNGDGTADGPGGSTEGVRFSISSLGGPDVTITDIAVSSSGAAGELREQNGGTGTWNHEVFIDSGTDGYLETGEGPNDVYTLGSGSTALTSQAIITDTGDATLYLYQFRTSGAGNSGSSIDMQDQSVTVELTFADGTTETVTFTG